MDIVVPPVNRATLRRMGAEARQQGGAARPLPRRAEIPILDDAPKKSAASRYGPLVSALGRQLSIPQLAAGGQSKTQSVLMTRVERLAGITKDVVAKLDGDVEQNLGLITTPKMASSVMRTARQMQGKGMSESDALGSSLAFHYLQGAAAHHAGERDENAYGYAKALKAATESVSRLKDRQTARLDGLGLVMPTGTIPSAASLTASRGITASKPGLQVNQLPVTNVRPLDASQENYLDGALNLLKDGRAGGPELLDWYQNPLRWWLDKGPSGEYGRRMASFAVFISPQIKAVWENPDLKAKNWNWVRNHFVYWTHTNNNATTDELAAWSLQAPEGQVNGPDGNYDVYRHMGSLLAANWGWQSRVWGLRNGQDIPCFDRKWPELDVLRKEDCGWGDDKPKMTNDAIRNVYPGGTPIENCIFNALMATKWCSVASSEGEVRNFQNGTFRPGDWTGAPKTQASIGDKAAKYVDVIGQAFDWVIAKIRSAANEVSALLCKGFKAMFGDTVGGFICKLVDVIIQIVFGGVAILVKILKDLTLGVVNLLVAIVSGEFGIGTAQKPGALRVIATTLNTLIVDMLGLFTTLLYPFTGPIPILKSEEKPGGYLSLESAAQRLNDREPLFCINVALATVGLVAAVGPAMKYAIGGLIIAMAPGVAVIFGQQFRSFMLLLDKKKYEQTALETFENGLQTLVTLMTSVVMAVMSMKDLYNKFREKYEQGASAARGGGEKGASAFQKIAIPLQKGLKGLISAVIKFKFAEVWEGIVALLPLVAVIILAFGTEATAADLKLIIGETYDAAAAVTVPIAKTVKDAKQGWDEITAQMTPADKAQAAQENLNQVCLDCAAAGVQCDGCSASDIPAAGGTKSIRGDVVGGDKIVKKDGKGLDNPVVKGIGIGKVIGISAAIGVGIIAIMAARRRA